MSETQDQGDGPRRRVLYATIRQGAQGETVMVTCDVQLHGAPEADLVLTRNNAVDIAQAANERLRTLLTLLLETERCDLIEVRKTEYEGEERGKLVLTLPEGVTPVTILNTVLGLLGRPQRVDQEIANGQEEMEIEEAFRDHLNRYLFPPRPGVVPPRRPRPSPRPRPNR